MGIYPPNRALRPKIIVNYFARWYNMDKEDKDGNKKEGEDMVVAEQKVSTFADFLRQNRAKIQRNAEANTTRNGNGDVVITRDDPSRNEHEWTESYRKLDES